jgi:hypothetical protein
MKIDYHSHDYGKMVYIAKAALTYATSAVSEKCGIRMVPLSSEEFRDHTLASSIAAAELTLAMGKSAGPVLDDLLEDLSVTVLFAKSLEEEHAKRVRQIKELDDRLRSERLERQGY